MIDIVEALDLLGRCVQQEGSDDRPSQHRDLVSCALTQVGQDTGANGRAPLTIGATAVIRAARRTGLEGDTWDESLAAAVHAAVRFVDLIPDSLRPEVAPKVACL